MNALRNVRFAVHSLWLCMFPVLSVTLAVVLLARVAQGTEVLRAALDRSASDGSLQLLRLPTLCLAMLAWSIANWYSCRVLLSRRFRADAPDPTGNFAKLWRKWFPRVAGVAGLALLVVFVPEPAPQDALAVRDDQILRWLMGGIAVVVGAFTIARRALFGSAREASRAYIVLAESDRLALWLALAFSGVLFVVMVRAGFGLSRFLGAPGLLFLALACVTLFGSIVLVYFPKAFGGPSMVALPLVVFFLLAQWGVNHNHVISDRAEVAGSAPADERLAASDYFKSWQATHPGKIVLVAAEGGASRSAWWTAHVLGSADAASGGDFSKHIFAISGVSGGSLGAATFAALLARRNDANATPANAPTNAPPQFPDERKCESAEGRGTGAPLAVASACMLGRDFLAPVIGYMLFPDAAQRFWPHPHPKWDRSLGLELSWRRDWLGLFGNGRPDGDRFGEPLARLYQGKAPNAPRTDVPLLVLNATRAVTGWRALQSPVKIDAAGDVVDDLQSDWPQSARLPLAAVVHNSARFPIVSPGGEVWTTDANGKREYLDALVDGGYFENSGAHSLLKLLQAIEVGYKDKPGEWADIRSHLVVVFIENDPPAKPKEGEALRPQADHTECVQRDAHTNPINQEELLTPLFGLYETRTARAQAARAELMAYVNKGASRPQDAVHFLLESDQIVASPPSMNWYMTTQSRQGMWNSLGDAHTCAGRALVDALKLVPPAAPSAKGGPA